MRGANVAIERRLAGGVENHVEEEKSRNAAGWNGRLAMFGVWA